MTQERTLAVIGAGNMGSGIAQKMATEGFRVILVDLNPDQVERGMGIIKKTLGEAVERKILAASAVDLILDRIQPTTDWGRLAAAELVVEAVFEDLNVKKDVFKRLASVTGPKTILGTNTSSFYVRDLAAIVPHPERVLGLHYFYHPAKNRLVEVVPCKTTGREFIQKAMVIQEAMGKTPILCADAPGFVVNRYFVPWLNEAVRLLDEGVADIPTIEAAAKESFKIGMGPFELMNVTGVPIALHAARTLGQELGLFYVPSSRLAAQVEARINWPLDGTPDPARFDIVSRRLFGVTFQVAGEIIDEKIAAIEDVDIGARVGLRWARGPFEMINKVGPEAAAAMAREVVEKYGRSVSQTLLHQAAKKTPFVFQLVETTIDGDVATLCINRPDAMNAINEDVVTQLAEAFAAVEANPTVKTVVLAGKGKAFIAGADIRFFVKNIESKNLAAIRRFTEAGQNLLNRFGASPKVVVARVDGLSLGGGSEIALACDYIVATEKGSFGFPETGIGIYPGLGGTQRLARRVGLPLARYYVLTGSPIDARTAASIGLVDRLCSHEGLVDAARELTRLGKPNRRNVPTGLRAPAELAATAELFETQDLVSLRATSPESLSDKTAARAVKSLGFKAPVALRLADELMRRGAEVDLGAGLALELKHLEEIFTTKDCYMGLSTLGKSKPVFRGE